jgi:hypothetical protein
MNDMLTENRTVLKDVIRAQAQALATVHDLSFKLCKGSFNRGQFHMVLQFGVPAIEAEMTAEFCARVAPMMGLPADIVGTHYTVDDIEYIVTGINPKCQSKCIRVQRAVVPEGETPAKLMTTPRRVREALGLADPEREEVDPDDVAAPGDPEDA